MERDRIEMSQRERDVLKAMSAVLTGKRTQAEAGRLLGMSVRQVRRIERRLEREGDAGVVHKLRGRLSNRRLTEDLHKGVIEACSKEYRGFGPTFAAEKLGKRGMKVGRETLRRWLKEAGLWEGRRRREKHRRRRERRECFGEMVQADGSPHDWLEGRGPKMTLLVMIDDATSMVVARFYKAETTEAYMDLLRRYLRKRGRMTAMYTDGNSIFKGESKDGEAALPTQFARALKELGITLIIAHSPQAKGRVERFNETAQDRLIKELRLAGARTMEESNEVVDRTFLPWFNRWHTIKPASPNNAHRKVDGEMNLSAILSIQHQRVVANDYTIHYENRVYQILPPPQPGLRGGKVVIEERRDGSLHIRLRDKYLQYELINPKREVTGALPPDPRSLPHVGKPAEAIRKEGRAAVAAQPSAVYPARGRSGRTPAEPCPPKGATKDTGKARWRPGPDHPWRNKNFVYQK